MCGRYYRRSDKQQIAEAFRTGVPTTFEILPTFNVCPQSVQPIVRLDEETGARELAPARWGLVPFWAKDPKMAFNTINAKAESVATSPTFREAFKRRRCLVPLDGFYEWEATSAKSKQPYAVTLSRERVFAVAGLWDRWKDKASGGWLDTFTVITTDPNELMERFHNRMPVILPEKDFDRWLEPGDPSRAPVDLLRPYPAEEMKAWKIGPAVGNTRNDHAGLIERLEEPPEPAQASLF